MGRTKVLWKKDKFYHVTIRGNNKQLLFRDRSDYERFFSILSRVYKQHPFTIAAYCVMPNHYHLLLRSEEVPLSKLMMIVNKRYSDHFRKKYDFVGQIYQKRYFSSMVDGNHGLCIVSRYIHRNPIDGKAPLTDAMQHYGYSSFKFFFNSSLSKPPFFNTDEVLKQLPPGYKKTLVGYVTYCRQRPRDKALSALSQWIEKNEDD